MLYLADNYVYGITILCCVVSAVYIAFSVRLVITSRREGINICALAFVPVLNIILWVRKCVVRRKHNKTFKEDEIIKIE